MRALIAGLVVAVGLIALWAGCGGECRVLLSGGLVVGCGDEPPGPGDPAYGTAAEVLLKDCAGGQLLWLGIAFDPTPTPGPGTGPSPNAFDDFEQLRCAGELNWIGGQVEVADDHPNGFFFDPMEIVVLADAPLAIRTTIAAIADNPRFFAPGGSGGQLVWVVPAQILAIETSLTLECPLAPGCTASASPSATPTPVPPTQ